MATVVEGGSDLFDALTYGQQHPAAQTFFQNQMERLSGVASGLSHRFQESMQHFYDRYSGSNAMRYAQAAKRAVGSLWQDESIRQLTTMGEFQHASLTMQRWVMAEPTVRRMFNQQRLEGYEGSYVDTQPGAVGQDHYDYRRVMDGFVVDDPNDEDNWLSVTYLDELTENDRDLILEEQVDIQNSWDNVVRLIRQGKSDPTSRWNADL